MEFKYGFEYIGVRYGWNKKHLYRLPFVRNNRSFDLLIIKPFLIGASTVYNIQRNKFTINKLQQRTILVNWKIEILEPGNCPF